MIKFEAMDARALFERLTESADELGSPVDVWARLAECWASVQAVPGTEALEIDASTASDKTKITVRWQPKLRDLTPRDRVTVRGRVYDIVTVTPIPAVRPEKIEITALTTFNE